MWSSFENLDAHADFHIRLQLRGSACVGKHRAELHAQTTHPGGTGVNIPVFTKRVVRLHAVTNTCGWINIWHLASGFDGQLVDSLSANGWGFVGGSFFLYLTVRQETSNTLLSSGILELLNRTDFHSSSSYSLTPETSSQPTHSQVSVLENMGGNMSSWELRITDQ